jgi:hypothetical protein
MLENAADVPQGHLAQVGVLIARKQRLAVVPDRLVGVHAEPLSLNRGLGMKVTVLPHFLATFLMQYL